MDDREPVSGRDGATPEASASEGLAPLPPPPPVGATLPDAPDDEDLPEPYEPPPNPTAGALWPGLGTVPPAEEEFEPAPPDAEGFISASDDGFGLIAPVAQEGF